MGRQGRRWVLVVRRWLDVPVGVPLTGHVAGGDRSVGRMRDDWSLDELVASWTLVGQDWELIGNKTGATRLGFALMLKFFELEARFPSAGSDFAEVVVGFVATPALVCSVLTGK